MSAAAYRRGLTRVGVAIVYCGRGPASRGRGWRRRGGGRGAGTKKPRRPRAGGRGAPLCKAVSGPDPLPPCSPIVAGGWKASFWAPRMSDARSRLPTSAALFFLSPHAFPGPGWLNGAQMGQVRPGRPNVGDYAPPGPCPHPTPSPPCACLHVPLHPWLLLRVSPALAIPARPGLALHRQERRAQPAAPGLPGYTPLAVLPGSECPRATSGWTISKPNGTGLPAAQPSPGFAEPDTGCRAGAPLPLPQSCSATGRLWPDEDPPPKSRGNYLPWSQPLCRTPP